MKTLERDTYQTYADYLTWPDNQVGELVDGIAYIREPPAPIRIHQEIVCELHRQVANAVQGKPYRAYVAPFDIRLPKSSEKDEQVDTVVQPDVFIVTDLKKLDVPGMRGAPDWIAEVLSPSTARYTRVVKLPAYQRAGVREVWLIQPIGRTVAIYKLDAGRYGREAILELKGKTRLTAVPEVTVDWDQVLAKIDLDF